MTVATYSFLNVVATLSGPGGFIYLGASAAVAEEGISAAFTEQKTLMTIGASGEAMHSLNASKAGTIKVRLLKTSPVNAQLSTMYNLQQTSSLLWAQNTIIVIDPSRGDVITGYSVAFTKHPDINYAKNGGMNEWDFTVSILDIQLGTGTPTLL